jgi:multiple sugar transport system substrate-binding protein
MEALRIQLSAISDDDATKRGLMKICQALMVMVSALALLPASLFTACTRSAGQSELVLAVNSGVEGDALKAAAKDYEAQRGVRITIAEFPYANLFEKELIDLVSRTSAYDIIMLDDPWFPRFTGMEAYLADLGPLYVKRGLTGPDSDFVQTSIALCRHPYGTGTLYALPYVGNSQLYFYRKDLFEKYSLRPPARWDDVLEAARVMMEKEKIHGYVMRAAQGNAAVADFLPLFWAFGAEMFDAQGRPVVNSPEGIAALKFMLELGKYSPPGYASFNADEVSAHLLQGTAAQSLNWPAWIPAFRDPAKSKVIGKVEITTVPGQTRPGQAEIGNWLLAIPAAARNSEAAFDFLLWATRPEQMRKSALRGNPPTRRSVFNDSELRAKYPSYPVQLKSLETSRPRPRTPLWNEIENAFGIYLSKANSGELTPEQAMSQAKEEVGRILARGQPNRQP